MSSRVYEFGPFRLDVPERQFLCGSEHIPLRAKVFDTLALLVENHGRLLTKDELMKAVWPDAVVEENNLNHNISVLRKALGEKATGQAYIETVPRVGYRFVAEVKQAMGAAPPAPSAAAAVTLPVRQEIRFCTARDGARIAYSTVGSGPPLVKAANWMNHLEFEWHSPIWSHWISELTRRHTVIRYDERGNGLSDWDVEDLSFEAWVEDLETVVNAAGVQRFALLGISQGGAVACAYAARHPERVSHLVLYGAFARGWLHRGSPEDVEQRNALITLVRLGWGKNSPAFRQVWTNIFIPGGSAEQMDWFNELQRVSASPQNAAELLLAAGRLEVVDVLPRIRVPTLVLHCEKDRAVPMNEGRLLAASIPGARFVPLPGRNHLVWPTEPAWPIFLRELGAFLGWESEA
ncbi:MAG TPA: alpha/beta fold hydrolase [Terriglobales bacterium]|nr:alpha/beta fold hydrolase [Terriglobales bacterium]